MTDDEEQDLVYAFADVMAEHLEWIKDARLLPCPKDRLYRAFRGFIRHFELLRSINPTMFKERGHDQTLELAEALMIRVSDFQSIDPEDEAMVAEANRRLDQVGAKVKNGTATAAEQGFMRSAMALWHKYLQRGMGERRRHTE